MMVQERIQCGITFLRKYSAGIVIKKPVDHQAVESGYAAEFEGGAIAQALEIGSTLERSGCRLQNGEHVGSAVDRRRGRFEFDHDVVPNAMRGRLKSSPRAVVSCPRSTIGPVFLRVMPASDVARSPLRRVAAVCPTHSESLRRPAMSPAAWVARKFASKTRRRPCG